MPLIFVFHKSNQSYVSNANKTENDIFSKHFFPLNYLISYFTPFKMYDTQTGYKI